MLKGSPREVDVIPTNSHLGEGSPVDGGNFFADQPYRPRADDEVIYDGSAPDDGGSYYAVEDEYGSAEYTLVADQDGDDAAAYAVAGDTYGGVEDEYYEDVEVTAVYDVSSSVVEAAPEVSLAGAYIPKVQAAQQPSPGAITVAPAADEPNRVVPAPMPGLQRSAEAMSMVAENKGNYARATTEQGVKEDDVNLGDILLEMLDRGASDLHLTSGAHPMIRVRGELLSLQDYPKLTPPVIQRVLYAILSQKQREKFEENLELDLSYALPGKARFRVNVFRQRESMGAVMRTIPYEIKPLEALGIPPVVSRFASLPRGLVLVTGPTGSGKSTTLAAIIDLANRTRKDHIMTVEDPIEFLHQHKSCLINQREVGEDTWSFSNALKHALRQDPDIILVGEMRDLETISIALTAAETGHLVFGTLHTQDAAQTMDRVIDVFPSEQQEQIRVMLAGAIQGVVCQTLCKTADGRGRVVATEVMTATPGIRNLVREGKTHQIYSAMQAGAQHGMHTLDQHLAELVRVNKITYEIGLEKCHHVEDYNRLTGRG